jgi:tRNA(fMet)-specific endonuclease VapC
LLQAACIDSRVYRLLPYTAGADAFVKQWRSAKIRIGAQDLRIAAIVADHGAKLVTRNARDYTQIPGLTLEIWN